MASFWQSMPSLSNKRLLSAKPNPDGDYIVALRFLPGEQLVTTILAIFKAGLAYVPIAPNWPGGRIEHIIADAAPIMASGFGAHCVAAHSDRIPQHGG
mgnify:CR=1 FL=1